MAEFVDTEVLISLVREYPYLYNKQDRRYKDTVVKENAWKSISETLNVSGKLPIIWKILYYLKLYDANLAFRNTVSYLIITHNGFSCS